MAAVAIAFAVYLPHIVRGGWYSDDWQFSAAFELARSHSVPDLWDAARQGTARPGHALLLIIMYELFGASPTGHLLAGALLAGVEASLLYLVLRLARLSRPLAAVAAALLIILPVADSTRLWPAAYCGPLAVSLVLAGYACALRGTSATGRRRRAGWHAAACLCFLAGALTYEIVLPLIALSLVVYLALGLRRGALTRWAADASVALVAVGVLARSGEVVVKAPRVDPAYVWDRLGALWAPTRLAFASILPAGALVDGWRAVPVLGLVAGAVWVALDRGGELAPLLRRALGLTAAGVAIWAAGLVMLVPGASYYLPRVAGTGNRLLVASAVGGALALVGAAVIGGLVTASVSHRPHLAFGVAAGLLAAASINNGARELRQQRAWRQSSAEATAIMFAVRSALPSVPPGSALVTFQHTTAVLPDGVPVFSSSWDLEGAVRLLYRDPSVRAHPWEASMRCSPSGLWFSDLPAPFPYRSLWFVAVHDSQAWPVVGQGACVDDLARLLPERDGRAS